MALAIVAAFSTYFAMYAFRKPFAAAKFEGQFFLSTGVALKTALVISQIVGSLPLIVVKADPIMSYKHRRPRPLTVRLS